MSQLIVDEVFIRALKVVQCLWFFFLDPCYVDGGAGGLRSSLLFIWLKLCSLDREWFLLFCFCFYDLLSIICSF